MTTPELPLISVVIPCRNERAFIGACLASILGGDWPLERLEVLVVDGRSDDGTRDVVSDHARRFPQVRLVDNPMRSTPKALNLGVQASRGAFVAIMSAHSTCDERYLSLCHSAMVRHRADNVGGVLRVRARRPTLIGRAIALALAHRFGAGNAYHRTGVAAPRAADTVALGFYRRDVFERIGGFNEDLVRGQDMELNLRLARAGGRIILDPAISLTYFARSDLGRFARHNFADGYWVTYAHRFARLPVTWRHLVPLVFVSGLLAGVLLWPLSPILLALVAGSYALVSIAASLSITVRERDPLLVVTLPVVFAVRHVAYGIGSVAGLAALLARPGPPSDPRPSPR